MGIIDKMFGRGADNAMKQPGSGQKFNQPKQKYNQRSIELQTKGAAFGQVPVDFILPRHKSDGLQRRLTMRNMKANLLILATSFVITGLFLQSPVIAQNFILVDFVTGNEGLRGDDNVYLEVYLRTGGILYFDNVNDSQGWDSYSEHAVRKDLPGNLTFDDIIGVGLRITFKWDLYDKAWDLDRFSVQLRLGDQYRLAFIESGAPLVRFTSNRTSYGVLFPSPPSIVLRVQFVTGSDDLRGSSVFDPADVYLTALLNGGGQIGLGNVNEGQRWDEYSEHVVYRNLSGGLNPSDIVGVLLEVTGSDTWDLNRLSVRILLTDNPLNLHREASGNPLVRFYVFWRYYGFYIQ